MRFILACLAPFAILQSGSAQTPANDDGALRDSLELLNVQMRLGVLETFSSRGGFYIPPEWTARLPQEQARLAQQLGAASEERISTLNAWLSETNQTRLEELKVLEKVLIRYVPEIKAAAAKDQILSQAVEGIDKQWQEWQLKRDRTSLEAARFVEELTKRVEAANRGPAESTAALMMWRSARNAFRGSVRETDQLVRRVAEIERARIKAAGRIAMLRELELGFKLATDLKGAITDKVKEEATARGKAWLEQHFPEYFNDEEATPGSLTEIGTEVWADIQGDLKAGYDLYASFKELNTDQALKANPTALAIVKRYTVLGFFYKQSLNKLKPLLGVGGLNPVITLLEFYGDAIDTLPEVARKVQVFVDRVDQAHKGVRAGDGWNIVGKEPARLRQLDVLDSFGLQVAVDTDLPENSPQSRYYMLVPKEVVPRGFLTLSSAEFHRMLQAVADERFINAPTEGSRDLTDWVTENMFEWRSTDPASAVASAAYLASLKKAAHKTPFKPKDLMELAHGQPITFKDAQWTAAKFRSRAEIELDLRAERFAVRQSIGQAREEDLKSWAAYKALLRKHGVAFTPRQILSLFNFYVNSAAHAAHLEEYLKARAAEAAQPSGDPSLGVPLVMPTISTRSVAPGGTVDMTADVFVRGLPPGVEVKAEVSWQVPGAKAPATRTVTLRNGVQPVTGAVAIPPGAKVGRIEAKVMVKILPKSDSDAAQKAAAKAAAEMAARKLEVPAPTGSIAREADHSGDVEVDAAGPLRIVTRPDMKAGGATVIEVTSEAMAKLDPKQAEAGLGFTLYRSRKPDGPFTEVKGHSYVFPDTPIRTEGNLSTRTAKDKVELGHSEHDVDEEDGKNRSGPFYFKVGQRTARNRNEPSLRGKEIFSNVTPRPGPGAILLNGGFLTENPLHLPGGFPRPGERFYSVQVTLGLVDQYYMVRGAHVRVTVGGQTRHYITPRIEGKQQFGPDESGAYVKVCWPSEGGSVIIEAEGDGFSATYILGLARDAKRIEVRQKQLDLARQGLAESRKEMQTQIKFRTEDVARLEKDVGDGRSWESIDRHLELARQKLELRRLVEVDSARTLYEHHALVAEATWDDHTLLQIANEELAIVRRDLAIRLAYRDADEAAWKKKRDLPGMSDGRRKEAEKKLGELAEDRKSLIADSLRDQEERADKGIAEAAYRAGDRSTYLAAQLGRADCLMVLKKDRQLGQLLRDTAADYFELSGNRAGAAELWTRGNNLSPENDRRSLFDCPWWPEKTAIPTLGTTGRDELKLLGPRLEKATRRPLTTPRKE